MAESQDAFSKLAVQYDAWYAKPIGAWADRFETESVFRFLALRTGEQLLDLGAGTGRHAAEAARRGAHVVAIDLSPVMLEIARRRMGEAVVALVRTDATRLPFRDDSFDAVLAVTSLCFVANPDRVLAEAVRVLRPGPPCFGRTQPVESVGVVAPYRRNDPADDLPIRPLSRHP